MINGETWQGSLYSGLAQLVEQMTVNHWVAGSSPAAGVFLLAYFLFSSLFSSQYHDDLTIEEKVGQILMVHFNGDKVTRETKTLIQEIKIGGIIYYKWANSLKSQAEVRDLSSALQTLAKSSKHSIPLFISTDQEGGRVTQLKREAGFTQFPSNLEQARNPELIEKNAYLIAKEAMEVGVNMNLAPVVDIALREESVINDRSYGNTPEVVITCASSCLQGFRREKMVSTLKHFPGHGDVSVDSHFALPQLNKSLDELEKCELLPFAKLVQKADAVMTAHLLVPALDPIYPSTLSKKTIDYLRDTIGFNGVVITDSLSMEGVLSYAGSVDEAAILALNAGCDILLLGGRQLEGAEVISEITFDDIKRIHKVLVDAVKSGCIQKERLDEACGRVLALKSVVFDN